jgi:uncharacterized lipoprotein YddW (UPF0748 family)
MSHAKLTRIAINVVSLVSAVALLGITGCTTLSPKTRAAASKSRAAAAAPIDEIRGLFVTTAHNADWPSQPGEDAILQKDEIDAIILRAQELQCNAIFLQVRAFGDRIYARTGNAQIAAIPWGESVSYTPNSPGYDPLEEWALRCHNAGIQLHAWINPYRTDWPITVNNALLPFFPDRDHQHFYLDPTSLDVQNYLLGVVQDLLDKYPPPRPPVRHPHARPRHAEADDGGGGNAAGRRRRDRRRCRRPLLPRPE